MFHGIDGDQGFMALRCTLLVLKTGLKALGVVRWEAGMLESREAVVRKKAVLRMLLPRIFRDPLCANRHRIADFAAPRAYDVKFSNFPAIRGPGCRADL
ncbi:MAG: hypothetical protein PVG78_01365 [Desulfobacterales bacterium]